LLFVDHKKLRPSILIIRRRIKIVKSHFEDRRTGCVPGDPSGRSIANPLTAASLSRSAACYCSGSHSKRIPAAVFARTRAETGCVEKYNPLRVRGTRGKTTDHWKDRVGHSRRSGWSRQGVLRSRRASLVHRGRVNPVTGVAAANNLVAKADT